MLQLQTFYETFPLISGTPHVNQHFSIPVLFSPRQSDFPFSVCADRRTDVIFALDSSDNLGDSDYLKQSEFVKKVVQTFDISPNRTRVGSILYSDQIEKMFNLDDYKSVQGVRVGLEKLGMTAGNNRVDLAMKHILTKGFRRSVSRADAAHVGVIITASPSR